jgi:AcrR family transcriptional regulator
MTYSLRERRRQMLRDEILEAAHALMTEKGYAALSMEELAARVGISKPTLYNQFPAGKEALVVAMAMQLMERVFTVVEGAALRQSPLDRLVELLRAAVHLQLEQGADAMQIWLPEVVQLLEANDASRSYLCKIDHLVVDSVREALAQGEIDPAMDVPSVVRIFNALIVSPNVGRLSSAGSPDPARMADTVAEVFRRGIARREGQGLPLTP